MKAKYGDDSSQYVTAVSVVRQVIQEVSVLLQHVCNYLFIPTGQQETG